MELLNIARTRTELHNTPVLIDHVDTGLTRPLTVTERLVISDVSGAFFEGQVLMRIGDPSSPRYFLHVGAEMAMAVVAAHLGDDPQQGRAAYQDADLLGDLRRGLTQLGA
ncbi:MAG: hypothetical protein ACSLEW_02390 [Nocardioides sp.]